METKLYKNVIMISKDEIDILDAYELTLLSTIRYMLIPKYLSSQTHKITLKDIVSVLNLNMELTSSNIKRELSKSFRSLLSKNILDIAEVRGKEYYINRQSLLINTNTLYVSVTFEEFRNIFAIGIESKDVKLFKYYVQLLSTININTKIGFCSIETLSKRFIISVRSIIRYNTDLEQRKLISIFRHNSYDEETGKFRRYNNIYYKPCDAEFVNKKFSIPI